MKIDIDIFYKPEKKTDAENLKIKVEGDFPVSNEDRRKIDSEWARMESAGLNVFSKPRDLATLFTIKEDRYFFKRTDYKTYSAISRTSNRRILSPSLYENMRIAAVGAYVETLDDKLFIHRRPYNASHVGGFLDTSCAGLCHVVSGNLNPKKDVFHKLQKELNLKPEEVEALGLVDVHSSSAPDFSGMFDFGFKTSVSAEELEERIKSKFAEYYFIKKDELPDFVIEHFAEKKDMTGDGAMALLGALDHKTFIYAIDKIKSKGKLIKL